MKNSNTFEAMELASPIQKALSEKGYEQPTPIQAQAIPVILRGDDVLGSAQTGTGKTAAFSLPILHHLSHERGKCSNGRFRALILTPTRELAVQVGKSFEEYGTHLQTKVALVYGGVSAFQQIRKLKRGVDILVATPGRLLDLYQGGHLSFEEVRYFVLDEADRMLDMGFIHDIRKIVKKIPETRQTLFFSATFSQQITQLASEILNRPTEIRIAPKAVTADGINHRMAFVNKEDKAELLKSLLLEQEQDLNLVFCRTKFGADKLATHLNRSGIKAEAIHGDKRQNARQRALESFRSGRVKVLIATDVAARGIDVKNIRRVINFDLPEEQESYIHRIGRTARGGEKGEAISFCSALELKLLRDIERLLKQKIPAFTDHAFHQNGIESQRDKVRGQGSGNRDRKRQNFSGRPKSKSRNFSKRKRTHDGRGHGGEGKAMPKFRGKRLQKNAA